MRPGAVAEDLAQAVQPEQSSEIIRKLRSGEPVAMVTMPCLVDLQRAAIQQFLEEQDEGRV